MSDLHLSTITLDGNNLTLEQSAAIAYGAPVEIHASCYPRIQASRKLVERLAAKAEPIYGINTGFGWLAQKSIPLKDRKVLQQNILLSHALGYGSFLPEEEARLSMALRLNVLLKGLTGVRPLLCDALCDLINSGIIPCIPSKGSVGASGDLAPLACLALPLIGEGEVFYQQKKMTAKRALKVAGLSPIQLDVKEGLSLVNGTQIMLAVGGMALYRALQLADYADDIAALSFEGACAQVDALNPFIHKNRGQIGQQKSAINILAAIKGSYLFDPKLIRKRIQDPYSLRCAPQVHGASRDTLAYAAVVIERELNAATDNPLVDVESEKILSGGNFHGQPLALALDAACMAVAEFANISERRMEVLVNPHMSGLNAFLVSNEGVNSGYMITQYVAGSLVNENKVLSHPACTDSISANVGIEDHVSMGMTSANKIGKVVDNTRAVLALEMMLASQAIDLRKVPKLGKITKLIYKKVREKVPFLAEDRLMTEDYAYCVDILKKKEFPHER